MYHDARTATDHPPASSDRARYVEHGLPTDWGSWDLVDATLRALREARSWASPSMVALISGVDYPLRHLDGWEAQVLAAPSWVGSATRLSYRPRWGSRPGSGDDRLTRYSHLWFQAPLSRRARQHRAVYRLGARLRDGVLRRTEPLVSGRLVRRGRGFYYGVRRLPSPFTKTRPCYIGSQWFAVRRYELDALLETDFATGSPLTRLYRHSIIPDESALVTPLCWRRMPSDLPPVSITMPATTGSDGIRVLTIDDISALLHSGAPFARKMDATLSAELMDKLDEVIRE